METDTDCVCYALIFGNILFRITKTKRAPRPSVASTLFQLFGRPRHHSNFIYSTFNGTKSKYVSPKINQITNMRSLLYYHRHSREQENCALPTFNTVTFGNPWPHERSGVGALRSDLSAVQADFRWGTAVLTAARSSFSLINSPWLSQHSLYGQNDVPTGGVSFMSHTAANIVSFNDRLSWLWTDCLFTNSSCLLFILSLTFASSSPSSRRVRGRYEPERVKSAASISATS